jgi:hypothetical protein
MVDGIKAKASPWDAGLKGSVASTVGIKLQIILKKKLFFRKILIANLNLAHNL